MALTLRLLGGLTTDEIARAFLVPEPTIAQRIVRAKRTLAEKQVPFEVPRGVELADRLSSVLEVIYLIFNEGYTATAGDDWMRPALCEDALRLGRILAELAPAGTRGPRPRRADGDSGVAVARARRSVRRADPAARAEPRACGINCSSVAVSRRSSGPKQLGGARGPYALQAAIAACHARARTPEETDWARIAALYAAARPARAIAGRGTESSGRRRDGLRSAGRPRPRRRADARSRRFEGYHLLAERTRRPARQARPRSTKPAPSSSARRR